MIRIGVIGYGQWGPNLARNLAAVAGCELAMICDLLPSRLATATQRHPGIPCTASWRDVIASADVDAVAIATPVRTHFELAAGALAAGKHVLVEKPITRSVAEAAELIELSERRGLVLMVDHTFVFSPPVRMMRELLASGVVGDSWYYDSTRANLGLIRHDVNVLWDLAAHDLAILDYLGYPAPHALSVTGLAPEPGEPDRLTFLTLHFPGGFLAHVTSSWLAPLKVRRITLAGSRRMLIYDDLEPLEKVKVYDRGIEYPEESADPRYRIGDVWSPELETTEPLRAMVEHFLECIAQHRRPLSGGREGLQVVRLLEASSRSLASGGRIIELDTVGAAA